MSGKTLVEAAATGMKKVKDAEAADFRRVAPLVAGTTSAIMEVGTGGIIYAGRGGSHQNRANRHHGGHGHGRRENDDKPKAAWNTVA